MPAYVWSKSESATSQSQVFTSSGTWTRPDNVTSVRLTICSAGGAGVSGASFSGGAGGGAGSCVILDVPVSAATSAVTCGTTGDSVFVGDETITVKAGQDGTGAGLPGGAAGGLDMGSITKSSIIAYYGGSAGGDASGSYGPGGEAAAVTFHGITIGPNTGGAVNSSRGGGGGGGASWGQLTDTNTWVDIKGGVWAVTPSVSAAGIPCAGGSGGGGTDSGASGGFGYVVVNWVS